MIAELLRADDTWAETHTIENLVTHSRKNFARQWLFVGRYARTSVRQAPYQKNKRVEPLP